MKHVRLQRGLERESDDTFTQLKQGPCEHVIFAKYECNGSDGGHQGPPEDSSWGKQLGKGRKIGLLQFRSANWTHALELTSD